jgi:transposase
MATTKQLELRKRVYNLVGRMKKSDIVNHFGKENISRSTIYSIIKRCENGEQVEDKPRKGRPCIMSNKMQKKLKNFAKNRVGVSQRKLASKFSVSRACIRRNLKKSGLKYYKRQKAPKYTKQQLKKIPTRCRKLRRDVTDNQTFIILDDEKYFTFSRHCMPGNSGFYSDNKEEAPIDVKFKPTEKFPPKILVWLALSSKGISQPYIGKTKNYSINAETYIQKCLPKLLNFINTYHNNDKYVFWPDLASSHYAEKTIEWLNNENIHFVPKSSNPPNVPKARPIEDFWSILSNKVYEGGWEAKNQQQLTNRIKSKLKQIDLNIVQAMICDIRKKLRKIEDKGPFSIL